MLSMGCMSILHPGRIVLSMTLACGSILAEDAAPPAPLELTAMTPFKAVEAAVDQDKDGVFSPAEVGAVADTELRGKLRAFDLDSDGALSAGEVAQAKKGWRGDRPVREKKEAKQPEGAGPAP